MINKFMFLFVHTICMILVASSSTLEFFINVIPFVFFDDLLVDFSNPIMNFCDDLREVFKL